MQQLLQLIVIIKGERSEVMQLSSEFGGEA